MSLLWLGSPGTGHDASTSEERTKKFKERGGREDLEHNQTRGLIVGAPAVWSLAGGAGRPNSSSYQPRNAMLKLECTSSELLWTIAPVSPAGLCHL